MLVGVVPFGLAIWGIVSAASFGEETWRRAGSEKVVWIVLQLCLGFIGSIAYLAAIRPKLKAAEAFAPERGSGPWREGI